MPDRRQHRGAHPADAALFSKDQLPVLRQAVDDFSWLLSGGYPEKASLKLVGDRFRLKERQRKAVVRAGCSRQAAENRHRKMVSPEHLFGRPVNIDGFNLLITLESALSGGVILESRDGCFRDLSGVHGSYKRVRETEEAIRYIGLGLEQLGVEKAGWVLDAPVSNSGRLKGWIQSVAQEREWDWEVRLMNDPDAFLIQCDEIVISSDSLILDGASQWFNLGRYIVEKYVRDARIIPLA